MRAGADEPELPLQQAGAPARVDDPSRSDLAHAAVLVRDRDVVIAAAVERDRLHAASVDNGDAERRVLAQQEVLEASAIELEGRDRRKRRGPELDARRHIAIVAAREEVAQPELLELRGPKMRLEAEPLLEIMRADLDARLADLERRLAHGVAPLLDDEHAKSRRLEAKLAREAAAREAAPENGHVVARGHCRAIVIKNAEVRIKNPSTRS